MPIGGLRSHGRLVQDGSILVGGRVDLGPDVGRPHGRRIRASPRMKRAIGLSLAFTSTPSKVPWGIVGQPGGSRGCTPALMGDECGDS